MSYVYCKICRTLCTLKKRVSATCLHVANLVSFGPSGRRKMATCLGDVSRVTQTCLPDVSGGTSGRHMTRRRVQLSRSHLPPLLTILLSILLPNHGSGSYLGGDPVLLMTRFTFLVNHPSHASSPPDLR